MAGTMTNFSRRKSRRRPSMHLGEPLDALSVDELGERIELLRAEIARLEAARERKSASRTAADSFFRNDG